MPLMHRTLWFMYCCTNAIVHEFVHLSVPIFYKFYDLLWHLNSSLQGAKTQMFMIHKYIPNMKTVQVHSQQQNIYAYVEYNYVFKYLAQAEKRLFGLEFLNILTLVPVIKTLYLKMSLYFRICRYCLQYKILSISRPPLIQDHTFLAEWVVLKYRDHCISIRKNRTCSWFNDVERNPIPIKLNAYYM